MIGRVEIFSEPLRQRYSASRCSFAYLFSLVSTAILFAAPFLLSGRNGELWVKQDRYREKPDVKFAYDLVFVAQAVSGSEYGNISSEIFFSTIAHVNSLRPDTLRAATVRSREADDDVDGLMDHFSLSLILPLDPGEQIYSIQVREILLVWDQPAMPLKERQSSFELHWSQHRVILCP